MPPLVPSGTLQFEHVAAAAVLPVANGHCSDPLLAYFRAHCPGH